MSALAGSSPGGGSRVGGTSGAGGTGGASACPSGGTGTSSSNVLTNGDFSASVAGWTAFGPSVLTSVSEPARSGNALSVSGRTETWHGAAQSLLGKAKSGQLLQFSAWVRVSVASAAVDFALKSTVAGKDSYGQVASGMANDAGWTHLTGSLAVSFSADPSALDLYVEGPAAGVTLFVDDVAAVLLDPPGGTGTGNADGSVSVSANVADKRQILEGFGASLAWHQDTLLQHAKASQLYPVLFADLGLDILRLRNRFQRSTEAVDLSTEQTIVAKATESLGHPPKILMTSWSPPAALKASGKEDCTNDAATCTLVKGPTGYDYAGFAKYWSDSLDAYAAHGIKPDYISIQNETDFVPGSWEGCRFEPSETTTPIAYPGYDQALLAVSAKLVGRVGAPRLIGPETLGVHWNRVQQYAAKLDTTKIAAWAHHLYEKGSGTVWLWQDPGPDAFVGPLLGALQVEQDKPIFMTEFQTDEDTLTSGGFETGWLLHDSLSDGQASAWLYWNLVWAAPGGLVALDGESYTIRDQYYALRHYAKFTEPGDVRVGVTANLPAIRATAWLAPDSSRLTFVLLNVGKEQKSVQLQACGFSSSKSSIVRTTFKTDGTSKRWEELGTYSAAGVELPARSMVTVVLQR